ncbi:hypothetical protein ABT039_22775 [Streptomyces lasiicapitis]|uniref:hypothetical protein n=1 Tax=Streptomyces lasiicapitis TaxID=1923961 RepID=UPI003327712C
MTAPAGHMTTRRRPGHRLRPISEIPAAHQRSTRIEGFVDVDGNPARDGPFSALETREVRVVHVRTETKRS